MEIKDKTEIMVSEALTVQSRYENARTQRLLYHSGLLIVQEEAVNDLTLI